MRKYALIIAAQLLSLTVTVAQNPISKEFNVQQLREEFAGETEHWNYMSTVENLYMPDKGDLFMHRNNPNSAYAFVSRWENSLTEFSIMSRLKLGPAESNEQSIGIICLVQRDGKGAVVAEFNRSKQFRVKQLVGSYYRYISGTAEDKGWVKSSALRGKEDYNELEVRVSLPQVDVYINGKFQQSFDVPDYSPGLLGLVIGPDTKAKADYFYVYTTDDALAVKEEQVKGGDAALTSTEVLSKLRYELEQKERNLRECETERRKAVSTLEERIGELNVENERLRAQSSQLAEFRDQVLVDIDEDAFLTITRSLKDEIIKNQRLESQVQTYRDSLKITHQNYSKLKLALLDKAIKKAEVDKVQRDRQEALTTRKEIENELKDKRLMKEQEEWERKNFKPDAPTAPAKAPAKADETNEIEETVEKALEPKPAPAAKATPLPIPVRKAQKSPN